MICKLFFIHLKKNKSDRFKFYQTYLHKYGCIGLTESDLYISCGALKKCK